MLPRMRPGPTPDQLCQQAQAQFAQGQLAIAANLLQQALAIQPRHPTALLGAGQIALQMGEPARAVDWLTRLLKLAPRHLDAYNGRGMAQLALREPALALRNFDKIVDLAPQAAQGHANRGVALLALHQPEQALAAFDHALTLQAHDASLHGNRGNALSRLHRWDEALGAFDTALALQPAQHLARWNIGMTLLRLGRWDEGWRHSEARLDLFQAQGWRPPTTAPRWDGQAPVAGQRVLVFSEQGLGDTLQFSRFVPLLQARGAEVIFSVQAPLAGLMSRHLPGVEVVARDAALPTHALHIPLMSLPLALSCDEAQLPPPLPLQPDPQRVAAWQERLGPSSQARVGVVWSGNPQQSDDIYRSLPLQALTPWLAEGVEWVSLQAEVQPRDLPDLPGSGLRHFGEQLQSFEDTAALCAHMDAVVSVCTSVAHLAGTLGRPLCLLAAHTADWRWLLSRQDSPWYPSATILRQARPGDWDSALAQLAPRMSALAASASASR